MNLNLSARDLIAFEDEIQELFDAGKIPSPVHLAHGNEEHLIDIFQKVEPADWVCCSWRSHYHCLLKGVSKASLKQAIVDGRSINLCFPEYRVISSAIVGGILPIAVGLAMAIKRKGGSNKVWAFIGDMTERTGIAHECTSYASGHSLPIEFVVEDNGLSVCTPTQEVWGSINFNFWGDYNYRYTLGKPHVGTGKFVRF